MEATRKVLTEMSEWHDTMMERLGVLEEWLDNAMAEHTGPDDEDGQVSPRRGRSAEEESEDGHGHRGEPCTGKRTNEIVNMLFNDLRDSVEGIRHLARCGISGKMFSEVHGACYVAPCRHVFEKHSYLSRIDNERRPVCPVCETPLI